MTRSLRVLVLAAVACGILTFPLAAGAGHTTDPSENLIPLGHIEEPAVLGGFGGGNPDINTDIAFTGKWAIQGNWDGFSIRDIRDPNNPKTVGRAFCDGNQGDVLVWNNLVIRSWNSPAGTPGPFGSGLTCGGEAVPGGWEGVHIFNIRDKANPKLVGSVQTPCGSHTASLVPDRENRRVLVYNSSSAHSATDPNPPATCDFIDIIEVPLKDPGSAKVLRNEPSMHTCHDIGIILGDVMKAACAGGTGFRVFSLGGPDGGSLEDPELLYHVDVPGVTIGHSAAFSGNGDVIIFGHEPGGGVSAACEATDPVLDRSFSSTRMTGRSWARGSCPERRDRPRTARSTTTTSSPRSDVTCSSAATTRRARGSSTSPTRRRRSPAPGATRRPSRFRPERRSAAT